ncbi:MAG TPA: NAD-dependent epimerase/dehydratase family protein [Solirubrobacterales bacterium]|jgi:UDP-glucose 4-epimerase|nr:NAD-dependent epimerase/dehydratase family protein [Solirubrobacterales bacterium]
MRTLVTGGAGFIGSNLVDALLARGDEVTVLDDLSTGRRVNLEGALAGGAVLAEVDVRDGAAVGAVLAEARPELVFHLAAQIDVRKSVEDPYFDAAINVGGTANVLEAARATGVGRVVFVSTGGALYGEGADKQLPLPESTPIAPLSGYGQSKFGAEGYLGLFERLHGLSGMSLRLGNVYGPRQDPLGEAGVVAIFCGLLKNGGRPTVYGDGSQTRDYIYVGDVVAAALAAGAARLGGAVNIGTGREASVLDIVEILAGIKGRDDFTPEFAQPRAGEVQRISLDAGLAERELDWAPQTTLEQGLKLTLEAV